MLSTLSTLSSTFAALPPGKVGAPPLALRTVLLSVQYVRPRDGLRATPCNPDAGARSGGEGDVLGDAS